MNAHVGIVVIGRNEGERLLRCLQSVRGESHVVYVDSGSTDGSIVHARRLGAQIVELDISQPFSAARGRNAGFQCLSKYHPTLNLIQFVDGDCELDRAWLRRARHELEQDDSIAVVCGQLCERHPRQSIYSLLCDMEWRKPCGEVAYCGGTFMVRAAIFRTLGGFDPSVSAGEEPELCSRIRAAGGRIVRVDAPMAIHDANMTRFGQWWNRNVRTGYGGLDVESRFGRLGFSKINRSAWLWTAGWPAGVCLMSVGGYLLGGVSAAIVFGCFAVAVLPAQIIRVAFKIKTTGLSWRQSLACASMTLLSKVAQVQGQVSWHMHHARHRDFGTAVVGSQ